MCLLRQKEWFLLLWSSTNYRRDPALRYTSADTHENRVWLSQRLAHRQLYSNKNRNFLHLNKVHHLIIFFPTLHAFMEESHPNSICIFFNAFLSTLSLTIVYLVFSCCCASDAHQVRRGWWPWGAPSAAPRAKRRVKASQNLQVSCARLQSDKQPGLPRPPGDCPMLRLL